MAKIEMDISEYEAIKENKKLLEKSLENERMLQETIKKLNKEKIQAIEAAKMKVVKTCKHEATETVLIKRKDTDKIINEIRLLVSQSEIGAYSFNADKFILNNLSSILFEKNKITLPTKIETTIHGLDEIKSELKESLEDEIKIKIKNAEEIISKYNQLMLEKSNIEEEMEGVNLRNFRLSDVVSQLKSDNKELQKEIDYNDKVKHSMQNLITNNKEKINRIKYILSNGYGLFNKSTILNKIIEIINR